jgi:hypothetical protein
VTYNASLTTSLEFQAAACAAMGSPFSAAILTAALATVHPHGAWVAWDS